jgi:hypothetical protein
MSHLSRREWLILNAEASAAFARPASSEPAHYWSAGEAAAQIRRRKISSEELTKRCVRSSSSRFPFTLKSHPLRSAV